ncbi:VOC family protein [Thauera sp. 63]|uniref:VOC family protein n=1 Tax=Thauera sp. 63 TaxID=497321 RepID=UPI0002CEA1F0|nr:VOC family protein [Thauera sp. 63]ENO79128.1 Glyoxalase/bleomycin resistance protein/dioxygenase [Thauera sp. 63]
MTLKHTGITRLGYVRVAVPAEGFDRARDFYRDTLGLLETGAANGAVQLRCWHEPYAYSMLLEKGARSMLVEVGFQVRDAADLERLSARVEAAGVAVARAGAGEAGPGLSESIAFVVPNGPRVRLFHYMQQPGYIAGHQSPDWVAPRAVRGTPAPMFLNHVAFTSDAPAATVRFLTEVLGFFVSEKIVSENGENLLSALLFRMSKNVGGQELAIFPGERGRLHHIAFTKEDASDILVDGQYLRQDGVALELTGPTRQPYGNTFSLHFRDPHNLRLELCSGGRMTEAHPEFEPVVWTESNAARAWAYYDDLPGFDFLSHCECA